jgi:flavorubredoxin
MKRVLKIIGKIFAGILVALISVMLICIWYVKGNDKAYGNHNEILKSVTGNSKKALVVYQPSRGKVTTEIAEKIAKGINDSGYEVTVNYPGDHLPKDISQYSIVVFGSPVYVGQTSSTLAQYMNSVKNLSKQKILLFVTGGQLNNGEVDKLEEQLVNVKATEKIGFKNGSNDDNAAYEVGKKIAAD